MDLGAASIHLLLPAGSVVSDLKLLGGLSEVTWKQTGNELFVSWNNLEGYTIQENQVLFSLYFDEKPLGTFMSSVNTEFANPMADVIHGFRFAGPNASISDETISIRVYPNPTEGLLQFSAVADKVAVSDLQGRVVFVKSLGGGNSVDLSDLPNGVYIVRLAVGDITSQHKVVLKD